MVEPLKNTLIKTLRWLLKRPDLFLSIQEQIALQENVEEQKEKRRHEYLEQRCLAKFYKLLESEEFRNYLQTNLEKFNENQSLKKDSQN